MIDAAAPRGSFVLRDGTRPVVLISAGVGATPVLAMLHALARERSARPVWWLHGARDRDEHAFGAEVDALLAALPRRAIASWPTAGPARRARSDYDVNGRLDLAVLDQADVPDDADYYVCGPDGFMAAIGAALTARGVAARARRDRGLRRGRRPRLRHRQAGDRPPHPPDGPPGTGPAVTFVRSNLDDRRGTTATRACSTWPRPATCPVGFGCRTGVCHNCESGLLAGAVTYAPDPLEPPPEGTQSRSLQSPRVGVHASFRHAKLVRVMTINSY